MSIVVSSLPEPGAPQVLVQVTGLSSPAVISVQRSWVTDEWHSIIGMTQVEAFTSFNERDFFVPLNVPTQYRVIVHSGTMSGGSTASITITSDTAWIQSPENPRLAVPIYLQGRDGDLLGLGSVQAAVYRQTVNSSVILGSNEEIASFGQRLAAANVPVRVHRALADEGGSLLKLLMNTGAVVVRGAPGGLLPAVAIVRVGDVPVGVEGVLDDSDECAPRVTTIDLTVSLVRSTTLRVVIAWWTYDGVEALWPATTYNAAVAARPGDTYDEWQIDPTPP